MLFKLKCPKLYSIIQSYLIKSI
uniref:Uncharacterized protein n=1 Tax=Anguilla anguilla TaxID=7936 RepID=A0A0E9Q910_ANGAN